jgi:hypothetical protein
MLCGNCKYWIHTGDRVKAFDDCHYTSRLGKCSNPVVKDLVFAVPKEKAEVVILQHSNEFDESFGCIYHEKSDSH